MTTIGLCMIVKDESRVILRCLENARPLVDYALLVDTGSTDGTQAIVKEFLSQTKLPGQLVEEPWRDFAYNRSFALAKLRERSDIDYALVMDADDILVFADGFDASKFRETLDRDYYSIENRAGGVRFWRAHILSNKVDFIYKGVLHEFVARPRAAFSAGVASGLHVQAGTEGARSRNPDKHRDDARTLEKALETEKDEFIRARYTFYLAQSWMRAGEKEKALHIFLGRAELGFFDQEVYLALYHAAELKEALGYPDSEVIGSYFKAYEADPRRAEALYGAMRYCRLTGKPRQAYLIGKHALTIAEPFGQLFVVSWIYDFGLLEEFAEAAYRCGHYLDSLEALEKILADGKIPESERPRIRDNARRAEEKLAARASARPRAAAETECQLMPVVPAQAFQAAMSSHREGRLAEAEQLYRAILEADHDHIDSLHNLGAVCLQQGKHVEAVGLLRETLRLKPDHVDAHNNLGAALRDLGRFEEAEALFRAALRLKADHPEAHHNLGVTLKDLGRLTEAEACIREALRLKPDYPKAHNSLGAVHGDQGRPADAAACYREALRLDPDYAEPHHNLGNALRDLGRLPEAESSYRKALSLKPDDPAWRSNLGMLLLLAGRFEEGWQEYEWRRSTKQWPARFTQPLWEGEAIGERVLLLHAEQGFGDTIQFCRYAPRVPSKARVILEAPRPLVRLLSSLKGVDQIVVEGDPLPPFDLHCPLLSLPRAFGTTLETIPAEVPYLAADAASVAAWRRRLDELPGLRVGLVWAGSARKSQPGANAIDRRRSITLDDFRGLATVPGVSFVSLQKGEPASQTRSPPPGLAIHDWTEELGDFADTAALLEALDLVITVDTATVHLAGALAKPVWLLNRFDTCWRWLLGRDDSPWYPTLRQFRQPEPGDWGSVLSEVRAALAGLASSEALYPEDRVERDPARSHRAYRTSCERDRPFLVGGASMKSIEGALSREPDEYLEDARRLEQALQAETDPVLRARYTFYLAQSYRDAGESEKALDNFLKRAELGHSTDEVFISLYRAAQLQEAAGRPPDEIIATYLRASAAAPGRAEAFHAASLLARANNKFADGYEYASRGLKIPLPEEGLLVEQWIYDYGLLDELAVNAYWTERYGECLEACARLLREGKFPERMRERISKNADLAREKLAARVQAGLGARRIGGTAQPSKSAPERAPMKVLLICGPWGSGTSAVAALSHRMGARGLGPYFMTNDRNRPNSYESIPFRETVLRYASQTTLSLVPCAPGDVQSGLRSLRRRIEQQELGPYDPRSPKPLFLKYPLSALVIPEICEVFDTKLIYVMRPLEDIERTRLRRNWLPFFGAAGAALIYHHMFAALTRHAYPTMIVGYADLLASPMVVAADIARFGDLGPSAAELRQAVDHLTNPAGPPTGGPVMQTA